MTYRTKDAGTAVVVTYGFTRTSWRGGNRCCRIAALQLFVPPHRISHRPTIALNMRFTAGTVYHCRTFTFLLYLWPFFSFATTITA